VSGEARARRRWARLQERLAITHGSELAGRFAGFGEGSVIDGPQLHVAGEHAIRVGSGVTVRRLVCLEAYAAPGTVVLDIGDRCYLGYNIRIVALNGIRLGAAVALGQFVTLTDTIHDYKRAEGESLLAPLVVGRSLDIGSGAWVGVGAAVIGGVTIGEKAIIAPNTIVNRDVEAGTMVSGNPTRIVKRLGPDGEWEPVPGTPLLGGDA
jgi:acetyltransferase-like isoleucine patch superfamily enzyme